MSKSIVKNSLYLLFCSFLLFSFLAPNSGYASDQSEIQLQSVFISKSSCFISISGITANCTSSLNTRSSTKLSIKMELQKKKSGTFETIKTWSASKTGTYLSVVYAADKNIGVSPNPEYISESVIQPYGTSAPRNVWNLASKGRYNFSGQAKYDNLYSNYKLTGVSRAKIAVYNYSSSTLTLKVVKDGFLYSTVLSTQVAGNTTKNPAVFYVNLDASKNYILIFMSPSNFSGYIEKA